MLISPLSRMGSNVVQQLTTKYDVIGETNTLHCSLRSNKFDSEARCNVFSLSRSPRAYAPTSLFLCAQPPTMFLGPGDLMALVSLVHQLVGAVDATSGASAEILHLRNYVESFGVTISCVSSLLKCVEPLSDSPACTALRLVNRHVDACRLLLKDFLERFTPYTSMFVDKKPKTRKRVSLHAVRIIFLEIWWALVRKKDATTLEHQLERHRNQIMLLLEGWVFIRSLLKFDTINRRNSRLIFSKMVMQIGFGPFNAVRVVDFMGTDFVVPWQLCSSWAVRKSHCIQVPRRLTISNSEISINYVNLSLRPPRKVKHRERGFYSFFFTR